MAALISRGVRELFRRELLPARFRWWFAAEGMGDWYRVLASDLAPHLGDARGVLSRLSVRMFERRYDVLWARDTRLPRRAEEPRAVALLMGGLYRVASNLDSAWIFDALGGAPVSLRDHLRAERLMGAMSSEARWEEVTTHLGELLIALTEGLPEHLPRSRPILGDICFRAGVRFATKMKKAYGLRTENAPDLAIELLRMSEYIFRVNPDHWGESDARTNSGWLEGTACPWYTAPGWNGAHCGIFGQFQSGISSVFGLKYNLSKTIPKHGGGTCRVDLKPIELRVRA